MAATLFAGIMAGSLYAIMGLGLTIIFGVVRIFNLSHGGMALLGGYLCFYTLNQLKMNVMFSSVLSFLIMFLLGYILYAFIISNLLKKPNWEFSSIVFLLGLGIFIENILLQIFGPRSKTINEFINGGIELGIVYLKWYEISLIIFAIVFVAALNLFLKKTWMGQAIQAVAQDRTGAKVVGIGIDKTFSFAFALATAVTGVSGILLGTKYYLAPEIGWGWMFRGFIIVVFGGLGSIPGVIYAAFILGITEAFINLYIGTVWVSSIWYIMFMVVLLVRPQGLLGGRTI